MHTIAGRLGRFDRVLDCRNQLIQTDRLIRSRGGGGVPPVNGRLYEILRDSIDIYKEGIFSYLII